MKKLLVLAFVLSVFLVPSPVEAMQPDYCPGIYQNINQAIKDQNLEAFMFWSRVFWDLC